MKNNNFKWGYNKNLYPIYVQDEKTNLDSFYGDIKHFEICYSFLQRHGFLNKKYEHHLDIGGAQGHFSFLLNILGVVKKSISLDNRNFSYSNFKHFFIYYHFVLRRKISKLIKKSSFTGKSGYVDRFSIYNNLPLFNIRIPNIVMSKDDIYSLNKKFDLVTSIASIEHFNFDAIFKKISTILKDNGVLLIMVDYWWYVFNSTGIFSKTPFAAQRFSYEELDLEIKKNNPELSKNLKNFYNYFHLGSKRPILDDYIIKAREYGLKFQSCQRLIPSNNIETRISSEASPNKIDMKEINTILNSISRFKKGVTIEDLHTMYLMMIFTK